MIMPLSISDPEIYKEIFSQNFFCRETFYGIVFGIEMFIIGMQLGLLWEMLKIAAGGDIVFPL